MDGIDRNADQTREANELYWESETSVNRIADQLGLSKGSLYAAIEPLASESFCPLCTARLVYANRTALDKGHLQCSKCSTEFTEKGRSGPTRRTGAADAGASATAVAPGSPPAPATPATPVTPATAAAPATPATNGMHMAVAEDADGASGQLKLGTAMLGLGVGLLLARVLRR